MMRSEVFLQGIVYKKCQLNKKLAFWF